MESSESPVVSVLIVVGDDLAGASREEQMQSIISGLKEAAQVLNGTGITLVIEPLNLLIDHAGYFLSRSDEAAKIIDAVDDPSIKMLFDIYHQQITEGNLINNIQKHISRIGHFHLADNPGRHQPGTGEINYQNVPEALEGLGCNAYIGLEFTPKGDSMEAVEQFKTIAGYRSISLYVHSKRSSAVLNDRRNSVIFI